MVDSPFSLKTLGTWVMLSGILLIFSSLVVVFIEEAIGIMIGIVYMLFLVVVGMYVASTGKVIMRSEMGGWMGSVQGVALGIVATVTVVFLLFDGFRVDDLFRIGSLFFVGNIIALVGEILTILMLHATKEYFMPSEEEIKRTEKILGDLLVTTVSNCPKCGELVEQLWDTCPYCGEKLPRICAKCGHELDEFVQACTSCGTVVEVSEETMREINGMRTRAEREPNPENRSTEYTKLGDHYVRAGFAHDALRSYDLAIRDTAYIRKQTLLMVKKARVLFAIGERSLADQMLDNALSLDKMDYAGAANLKASVEEA